MSEIDNNQSNWRAVRWKERWNERYSTDEQQELSPEELAEREQALERIRNKLALLPDSPGCYLMKNHEGTIIYVGKAKVLKNRVRSYLMAAMMARRSGWSRKFATLNISSLPVTWKPSFWNVI